MFDEASQTALFAITILTVMGTAIVTCFVLAWFYGE